MGDQTNIPCYVVQMNNTQYVEGWTIVPRLLEIPCKNDFIDDPDYWAVPIKDDGVFSRFQPVPVGASPSPPTFDSFPVFRVRDKLSGYTWWIYGTHANFNASCGVCCGSAAIPMPNPGIIEIAPCNYICAQNASGQFITTLALPGLVGHEKYFPYGSYNNVALPAASGAGYSTPAALLTFLNASWNHPGSPVATLVWSLSADNLTLIATGGFLGDELCAVVATVGTSA